MAKQSKASKKSGSKGNAKGKEVAGKALKDMEVEIADGVMTIRIPCNIKNPRRSGKNRDGKTCLVANSGGAKPIAGLMPDGRDVRVNVLAYVYPEDDEDERPRGKRKGDDRDADESDDEEDDGDWDDDDEDDE